MTQNIDFFSNIPQDTLIPISFMKRLILAATPLVGLFLIPTHGVANDAYQRSDAFDYKNITNIVATQHYNAGGANYQYFDVRDLFGGTFGTGETNGYPSGDNNGEFVFQDGVIPPNRIDFVQWETHHPIMLSGYRFALRRDWPRGREVASLKFFSSVDGINFTERDSFVPDYIQSSNSGLGTSLQVRRLPSPVRAKYWRMEVVRADDGGSRLAEIDAVTVPNIEKPKVAFGNLKQQATYSSADEIPIVVEATDPQGIGQVTVEAIREDSPNDLILIGLATEPPFRFSWSYPIAGNYRIRAKVADWVGATAEAEMPLLVQSSITPPELGPPRIAAGFVHMDVTGGGVGRRHLILASDDQMNWFAVKTNRYPGAKWTFSEKLVENRTYQVKDTPNVKD